MVVKNGKKELDIDPKEEDLTLKGEENEDPDERKLTPRQKMFVEEYLVDLNATQAYLRVYKSCNGAGSARTSACQLLALPHVRAYKDKLKSERVARVDVAADFVVNNLVEVVQRCMQKVPVCNQFGSQIKDDEGHDLWRFDSNGANKALDLLGKHLGIFTSDPAATTKVTVDVQGIREALIQESESRYKTKEEPTK